MQIPPASANACKAGRDVDAVSEDVALLHHDVADIDADAKPHAPILDQRLIRLGKVALDLDGALHSAKDAGKFGEHAVAGRSADAAAVPRDQRVDDASMRGQGGQRALFVGAHQPAIPLDVGGENGNEFSFEGRRFHRRPGQNVPLARRFQFGGSACRIIILDLK